MLVYTLLIFKYRVKAQMNMGVAETRTVSGYRCGAVKQNLAVDVIVYAVLKPATQHRKLGRK